MALDEFNGAGGGKRRRDVVVGEFKGDGMWRVAVHVCEGVSVGVILACARDGGMNNNTVNVCTWMEEGIKWLFADEEVAGGGNGGVLGLLATARETGCGY